MPSRRPSERMPGVLDANVAYAAERLVVEYDSSPPTASDRSRRSSGCGFELEVPEHGHACCASRAQGGASPRSSRCRSSSPPARCSRSAGLRASSSHVPAIVPTALRAGSGRGRLLSPCAARWSRCARASFDIETLMVLAGVGAALLGAWFEGAFLLFLFSLGHALEHRAMDKARRSIEALGQLRPETARVKRDGEISEVPMGKVQTRRHGGRAPGRPRAARRLIRTGKSRSIRRRSPASRCRSPKALATTSSPGRSTPMPRSKSRSRSCRRDSMLARIIDMVAEAEAQKSPTQRFAKRLERIFVPIVLVIAPMLALVLILRSGT